MALNSTAQPLHGMSPNCVWESPPPLAHVAPAILPLVFDMLQLNFKTCENIVPWYMRLERTEFLIIALITAFLTIIKPIVMKLTLNVLVKRCDIDCHDSLRASEMIFDWILRIITVAWTAYDVLILPSCTYLKTPLYTLRSVWATESTGLEMSVERRLLLLFTIGKYVSALFDVLFISEKRRDSISLFVHHVVAVLMMTAAYTTFPDLGLSVFLLHETCDVSLELAKILHYMKRSKNGDISNSMSTASDVCFAIFIVKWFVLRMYLYPVRGMFPATFVDRNSCHYGSYAAAAVLALLLFILNLIWSFMILRALVNRMIYNRLTDETMDRPEEYEQKFEGDKKTD